MEKKYWYDLKEEERSDLLAEWAKSSWHNCVMKSKKGRTIKCAGYYIYNAFALFLIPNFIFTLYIAIEIGDVLAPITIFMLFLGVLAFLILSFWGMGVDLKDKEQKEYVEEEFSKWLLEKHNVVK